MCALLFLDLPASPEVGYLPNDDFIHQRDHQCSIQIDIIKGFYKNCKNVGMTYKGQQQVKAVTQWSINHGPYVQEWRTL